MYILVLFSVLQNFNKDFMETSSSTPPVVVFYGYSKRQTNSGLCSVEEADGNLPAPSKDRTHPYCPPLWGQTKNNMGRPHIRLVMMI